jgi:hypothetical protein
MHGIPLEIPGKVIVAFSTINQPNLGFFYESSVGSRVHISVEIFFSHHLASSDFSLFSAL